MKTLFLKLVGFIFIINFLGSCASDNSSSPIVQQEDLSVVLNNPIDGSNDIASITLFEWSVNGIIDGTTIMFDLYLGFDSNNLELIEENININSFNYSKILTNQNTYYWKIIATDSNNRVAESSIFTFSSINDSGIFIDPRDNEEYNWIGIGNQKWMVNNLRFNTSNDAIAVNNDESTIPLYGRLYYREDALISCPEGWHLPSNEEFNQLIDYVGIEREFGIYNYESLLKSTTGWEQNSNGNNYSGYNHFPTGNWKTTNGFSGQGEFGYQWSSSEVTPGQYSIFGTETGLNTFIIIDQLLIDGINSQRHCVRCLKD